MKVRKVIGGGEMRNWEEANGKYRGGGNYSDAMKLLLSASEVQPGMTLRRCYTINTARQSLGLPCGLGVPVERESFEMKNFNDDATAGPALRAFGIFRKAGLKAELEDFAFNCLNKFALGAGEQEALPFVTARVGYRTKLLEKADAMKKISEGKPLGRCVMMLDAHEQAFATPLYNVLSGITDMQRHNVTSGFRNTIVRASSDWSKMWSEVRTAACIVELDWKKFDRERPYEDIEFLIDVIISCFAPRDDYERRFLEGYCVMLRRSLLDRPFITDDGGAFTIHGMVPSGSLWTGWLDTALNILYIRASLRHVGIMDHMAVPKCAGDDNLTLFYDDVGNDVLMRLRSTLNEWFRAGIEDEDYKIHRPPYHIPRFQAIFPPGFDLSKGTSDKLDMAEWREIEGEMIIDEEQGLSHRWKYVFEGRPCFLSCYWLEDGSPIRPSHINLEKLLFPEGVHKDIHEYEAAVISMAVDNPFNHHNVNHLMHRFVIVQQVKRISSCGLKPEDLLTLAKFRPEADDVVPFPMIAQWRRAKGYVDMESLFRVKKWMNDFRDFVSGVTTLYARAPGGGLDAWRFMDILRGEHMLAERQYGNDMEDWIKYLKFNPVSSYLKPIRKFRAKRDSQQSTAEVKEKFEAFLAAHTSMRCLSDFESVDTYTCWLADKIRFSRKRPRPP